MQQTLTAFLLPRKYTVRRIAERNAIAHAEIVPGRSLSFSGKGPGRFVVIFRGLEPVLVQEIGSPAPKETK